MTPIDHEPYTAHEGTPSVASMTVAINQARTAALPARSVAALYGLTVFLAAGALFLVQPMIAKGLLPLFGGTPGVWTTSMLFFQAALLGGYGLAHLSLSRLGPKRQSRLQLILVASAFLVLPVAAPGTSGDGDPLVSLLLLLGTGIGLPFLALSTASPVLQRWFSVSGHPRAHNPYVLYVASNVGSLVALLAYPFLVEPMLPLAAQRVMWSVMYVGFVVLMAACALSLFPLTRRSRTPAEASGAATATLPESTVAPAAVASAGRRVQWRTRAWWLFLSFVPSSLMLGVTTFLTTDIASVPLLWVAPLSLYLLSFVVAFSRVAGSATRAAGLALPFLAVAAAIDTFGSVGLPVGLRVTLHLALFTTAAILCHGRLAASRPEPTRLTEFYFVLAVGGVTGGIVNAIIAPQVLEVVAEYPLAIGAALLARGTIPGNARRRWALGAAACLAFLVVASVPLVLGFGGAWSSAPLVILMSLPLLVLGLPVPFGLIVSGLLLSGMLLSPPPLMSERNFFGLFRVLDAPGEHVLVHGTTIHGTQSWPPEAHPTGTGYYHPDGPLGDVIGLRPSTGFARVGVIGLGSGGMVAHMRAGQRVTFYEIDPAVAVAAADNRFFTYLSSTPAEVDIRIGDGRLLVEDEPSGRMDLLIIDAFSSDSVPTHLLTREAFSLYFDRLTPNGLLLVHVSNRYLDLVPVIGAAARDLGLVGATRHDAGFESQDVRRKRQPSRYVVVSRSAGEFAALGDAGWHPLPASERRPWTDDYSEIVSLIDWEGNLLR